MRRGSSRACRGSGRGEPIRPRPMPRRSAGADSYTARMPDRQALLDAMTARLAPLDRAANQAWWDASTDVSEAHEAQRIATDLALRAALADAEVFAAARQGARRRRRPRSTRQLTVLRNGMLPQQVPADIREQIVRLEASIDAHVQRPPARSSTARPSTTTRSPSSCAAPTTATPAGGRGRRRRPSAPRWPTGSASSRTSATPRPARSGTATTSRSASPRPSSTRTTCSRTLDAVDDATRDRFAAWKAAADAARADALRRRRRRAPAVALRRPVLPVGARRDRPRPRPVVRRRRPGGADPRHVRGHRARRRRRCSPAATCSPRPGKSQHAFCIDVDRGDDVRVLCNNVPGEYWTETMLHEFGHAVYDLHVDRRPAVARPHDAPAHDRGRRDALRPADARPRVAHRRRRRRARRGRGRGARRWRGAASPRCSCSRAGCW